MCLSNSGVKTDWRNHSLSHILLFYRTPMIMTMFLQEQRTFCPFVGFVTSPCNSPFLLPAHFVKMLLLSPFILKMFYSSLFEHFLTGVKCLALMQLDQSDSSLFLLPYSSPIFPSLTVSPYMISLSLLKCLPKTKLSLKPSKALIQQSTWLLWDCWPA